ncbi:MAG TPA: ATP-binding protein, partial [Thermodesulfobacteriota bacterium]|nr:ATP-binding protein [Thermodesulfobacteriota bacterium]
MQKKINELLPENAYRKCDLSPLGFKTTEELEPCKRFIGQERAENAIHFGLGMEPRGYNLYLAGPPGVGKTSSIKEILSKVAKDKPVPPDWCYVYNFQSTNMPMSISLPTGKGKEFKKDMDDLLESLKNDIPRAFESKEFEEEKDHITNEAQKQKNDLFEELHKKAAEQGIQIQFTPTGIVTIPLFQGKPITQEEYNNLDEVSKEDIKKRKEKVDEEVPEILKKVRKLEKETMEKIKELEKKVALFAVRDILDSIREKYKAYPKVIDYLDMMQKHILENIDNFMMDKTGEAAPPFPFRMPQQKPTFTEYQVNVFIDNSNTEGAPVIFETHPTYTNLVGSIEREARFGALVTDFTMITAGSIAKANGGYLVVEVMDILKYPFVWDALKKVLENEELRIEDVYQHYGMSTVGLRPEPIDLDIKVIMTGNPTIYYLLYTYDEDFMKLFKVKAD